MECWKSSCLHLHRPIQNSLMVGLTTAKCRQRPGVFLLASDDLRKQSTLASLPELITLTVSERTRYHSLFRNQEVVLWECRSCYVMSYAVGWLMGIHGSTCIWIATKRLIIFYWPLTELQTLNTSLVHKGTIQRSRIVKRYRNENYGNKRKEIKIILKEVIWRMAYFFKK